MKEQLENALGRKLTKLEARYIEWLQRQDRETQEVFTSLFGSFFKAGQEDANAYHEAMARGSARD